MHLCSILCVSDSPTLVENGRTTSANGDDLVDIRYIPSSTHKPKWIVDMCNQHAGAVVQFVAEPLRRECTWCDHERQRGINVCSSLRRVALYQSTSHMHTCARMTERCNRKLSDVCECRRLYIVCVTWWCQMGVTDMCSHIVGGDLIIGSRIYI